ncbi:MAG TPA: PH domain-containing protein, partial [Solirubrobacteraceae bacterium]|nr:PH domain-containing protein [Solirubrobacteraceae bacterium]
MSDPPAPPPVRRGRLHPLAIVVFARRMVGASALPIIVLAFTWRPTFVIPGLLALAGVGLVLVYLEWRRFTYRIETGRLTIERGVFRHTTRVVALDRIRGVDLQAPWLHRVLGLVRVDVEAAAGGTSAAELSLAAVSSAEGERLRQALLSASRADDVVGEEEVPPARALYRASPRLLVAGGLTSGRYILAPLAIIGIVANFADDLPGALGERLLGSAADRLPTDVLGIAVVVAGAVLLALALAAAGSLLADWNFELTEDGDRLVARRGLLTRRTVTIDRARVRGLDLRDSPLRRAFDLVGMHAIAGGIQGGQSGRTVLAPVISTTAAPALLRELDPLVQPNARLEPHPHSARTRRLVRAIVLPAALGAIALGFTWWWGAAALLVLAAAGVPLALDRYR